MSTELTTQDKEEQQNEVVAVERTREGRTYSPRVDIWETADELILYADVPGVQADDLDIRFENRELTINAKVAARHESIDFLYGEYGIGNFYRTFSIGESINSNKP